MPFFSVEISGITAKHGENEYVQTLQLCEELIERIKDIFDNEKYNPLGLSLIIKNFQSGSEVCLRDDLGEG